FLLERKATGPTPDLLPDATGARHVARRRAKEQHSFWSPRTFWQRTSRPTVDDYRRSAMNSIG
ncbi:MAG: hypothetical protein Q7U76_06675, partial [Nitrospirota bacterium]|nr:hypothetical protein [Nitrospirota bacterium]